MYHLGQKFVNTFTKLSKIGFSMDNFMFYEFSQIFIHK